MFSRTLNCGNCGQLVDFNFSNVHDFRLLTPEELNEIRMPTPQRGAHNPGSVSRIVHGTDKANGASLSQCPRCNYPTLIIFETTVNALNSLVILDRRSDKFGLTIPIFKVLKQFPPEIEPDSDPLWPENVRRNFSDAQKMLAQGISPSIVLTTCGTVLELALKELDPDERGSTLSKRIDKLHDKNIITSPVKDWAHDIRLDRNSAVHEGEGSGKDAAEYIEFLKLFFNMAFSLPNRISEKRNPSNLNPDQPC
ncbi:DUF4145 domain-containing protein [Phaeobacter inhibens]|uniref:DUF4145 domain-containing protein n=1 Tax=Phaeobacter inhibens TaxID=221822 RepID=UPI0021A88C41|nr:DUF4145 domain-containing protein [Phaeobacter inhibens]UWR43679.1 DUF4145 domain-containing protein [Phaeobacter inhibens]